MPLLPPLNPHEGHLPVSRRSIPIFSARYLSKVGAVAVSSRFSSALTSSSALSFCLAVGLYGSESDQHLPSVRENRMLSMVHFSKSHARNSTLRARAEYRASVRHSSASSRPNFKRKPRLGLLRSALVLHSHLWSAFEGKDWCFFTPSAD